MASTVVIYIIVHAEFYVDFKVSTVCVNFISLPFVAIFLPIVLHIGK